MEPSTVQYTFDGPLLDQSCRFPVDAPVPDLRSRGLNPSPKPAVLRFSTVKDLGSSEIGESGNRTDTGGEATRLVTSPRSV